MVELIRSITKKTTSFITVYKSWTAAFPDFFSNVSKVINVATVNDNGDVIYKDIPNLSRALIALESGGIVTETGSVNNTVAGQTVLVKTVSDLIAAINAINGKTLTSDHHIILGRGVYNIVNTINIHNVRGMGFKLYIYGDPAVRMENITVNATTTGDFTLFDIRNSDVIMYGFRLLGIQGGAIAFSEFFSTNATPLRARGTMTLDVGTTLIKLSDRSILSSFNKPITISSAKIGVHVSETSTLLFTGSQLANPVYVSRTGKPVLGAWISDVRIGVKSETNSVIDLKYLVFDDQPFLDSASNNPFGVVIYADDSSVSADLAYVQNCLYGISVSNCILSIEGSEIFSNGVPVELRKASKMRGELSTLYVASSYTPTSSGPVSVLADGNSEVLADDLSLTMVGGGILAQRNSVVKINRLREVWPSDQPIVIATFGSRFDGVFIDRGNNILTTVSHIKAFSSVIDAQIGQLGSGVAADPLDTIIAEGGSHINLSRTTFSPNIRIAPKDISTVVAPATAFDTTLFLNNQIVG